MTTSAPGVLARLQVARARLHAADPVIAGLIDRRPDYDPRHRLDGIPPMDLFGALVFQVTGQQLSVASRRRILDRIQEMFGGHLPSPAELLQADPAGLRQAGLSGGKVSTLRDLAERLADGRLNVDALSARPDEQIIAELTQVPGIGPWTVQGALILGLNREDVVLPGDLALRKAVRDAYQLDHLPTPDEVLAIAERWRPYRSLATLYLFLAGESTAAAAADVREEHGRSHPTQAKPRTAFIASHYAASGLVCGQVTQACQAVIRIRPVRAQRPRRCNRRDAEMAESRSAKAWFSSTADPNPASCRHQGRNNR